MDQSEIDDKTGMFYFIISCVLSLTSRPTKQNLRKERKNRHSTLQQSPISRILVLHNDANKMWIDEKWLRISLSKTNDSNNDNFMEMFFVSSRAWDKKEILSPHDEANFRPSDFALRFPPLARSQKDPLVSEIIIKFDIFLIINFSNDYILNRPT